MRVVWIATAAVGIVAGTWLASMGSMAVVVGQGDRDGRALLGLLPLIVGGLLLIGSVRIGRSRGGGGRLGRGLPRPIATAVIVPLGVVLTLLVMFLAFVVRFSGGWPPPSPATGEVGRLPEWGLLLYWWLVSGTYLAAMVLPAVALGKMGSLPGVGMVLGVLLAIAGLVGGPTRYELFIAPLGAAVSVASALAWRASAADAARRGNRAE